MGRGNFGIFLVLVGSTSLSWAASSTAITPLPTAFPFPNAVNGIIFPGFNLAGGVNPAALPLAGKAGSLQLAYGPALRQGDNNHAFGGLAIAKKGIGIGLGYHRNDGPYGMSQGVFGGAGFSIDQVAFGVGVRDTYLQGGFHPNVDIGILVGDQKTTRSVSFGGVFYNLDNLPQMAIGIGYGSVKKYTLEANVLLPPFDYMDNGYFFTVAASLRAEFLGLYFRTSYGTSYSNFSHTVGLMAWVAERFSLFAQFITSRTLSAGFNVVW